MSFFSQLERARHSKTVTWADDPQMNFKRAAETTPTYDSTQLQSGAGETPRIDSNQLQQQQQQLYQYENESYATETNAPIQYSVSDGTSAELQQSDAGDQSQAYYYGDGSTATAGGAIDPATGAYYDDQSGQQMYQDQYYYDDGQNAQQQQPQQQYAVSDAQQVKSNWISILDVPSQFEIRFRIRINRIIKISSNMLRTLTPLATFRIHSSSNSSTQMVINTQTIRTNRVLRSHKTLTTNKPIRITIKLSPV